MCIFLAISGAASGEIVIDHTSIEAVASYPQSTMDLIGEQSWYFAHASVGGNMLDGMASLAQSDPSRFLMDINAVDDYEAAPPSPELGTVYENHRGNPPWQDKITMFEDAVRDLEWRDPNVHVVMNKLCYIDWMADAQVYLESMAMLEAEFPETVFVYMTIPLKTAQDSESIARAEYNQTVREFCQGRDCILLDIADIESHDPDGNLVTFNSGGVDYPIMFGDYTYDGGHLTLAGAERVALGWYAAAAAITSSLSPSPMVPLHPAQISKIAPNPFNPATTISLDLPRDTEITLSIYDLKGMLVQRVFDGQLTAGSHDFMWRGLDTNGQAVSSGVYSVRMETSAGISTRSISLVR